LKIGAAGQDDVAAGSRSESEQEITHRRRKSEAARSEAVLMANLDAMLEHAPPVS
jgi:hypothetical protein